MALYRLVTGFALATLMLSACGQPKTRAQPAQTAVVDVSPSAKATADVDKRATLALKQSLLNSFPQNSPGTAVEAGLIKDSFACGPNPTAPNERACLRAVREGVCEINTIVRTTPYAPEKAQVIKICEITPPTTASK